MLELSQAFAVYLKPLLYLFFGGLIFREILVFTCFIATDVNFVHIVLTFLSLVILYL